MFFQGPCFKWTLKRTKLSIRQSLLNFRSEVALEIIHLFGYEMPLNYQN